MPKRASPWIDMNYRNASAPYRLCLRWIRQCLRMAMSRHHQWLLVLAIGITTSMGARAAEPKPEGMKGWWYFISMFQSGYASTPEEACRLSAANHFGVKLDYMTPSTEPRQIYHCFYRNSLLGGLLNDYSVTELYCESGYGPKSPGICVKWPEAPRPPSCTPGQPGFTCGNPVVVSSGAKVQTETDMPGLPNGALRITRTYRSFREGGTGQSAGQAWSFSFDRHFAKVPEFPRPPGTPPFRFTGSSGGGAYFEFSWEKSEKSGVYVSKYDKRETLQSLNAAFDDWAMTTHDGSIERFKKVNGKYALVSSHSKEGVGQFYTYGADNKLATIADARGRTLKVTWAGDNVASITGATGAVRYGYERMKADNGSELAGSERLATVEFYDEDEALLATRRYHYEDPSYGHLLTGITDENGVRFATYAYNASAQAVLSEQAGGANRYTFAYPEKAKRIITDPLGTQREIDLAYHSRTGGIIARASQPAGAGSGPGFRTLNHDYLGRRISSIDFNGVKTCFITEPARGLVTSEVSGLMPAAGCPANGTGTLAAGSRRISKQWHPDLELETAVASAKQITRYVYNGQRDASGNVASCAENAKLPNGKALAVLCAKTIQATRDSNGAEGFAAQPAGRPKTWRYSYNASGQLLKQTGPANALGQAESFSHVYYNDTTATHTKGDLASAQDAAGGTTQFLAYTKDGRASKIRRTNGVFVNVTYDARQRLTSRIVDDGKGGAEATEFSYDDVGQLTRILSPDGSVQTFGYDDAHRMTSVSDGAGNRIQLTLDNMGNVTRQEVRNSAGNMVRESNRAFDALNRLASVQHDLQSPATTYQYDPVGNLTTLKDALGRVTTRKFDNLDRMVQEVLPPAAAGKPASTIAYGFDHQDQVISVTDPRKLVTSYALDGYGQLATLSSPDTGSATYAFDDAGNMVSSRDGRLQVTAYKYDAAQRVTQAGGSTFDYGAAGTGTSGRITKMRDESGQTSFEYDGFGRIIQKTQQVGTGATARTFVLKHSYGSSGSGSATGHVTSTTYPSGNRIRTGYGSDGKIISLALETPNGGSAVSLLSNIKYVPWGGVESWIWGASATGAQNVYTRRYDARGRLVSYPLGPVDQGGSVRTLSYDNADRILASKHTGHATASRLDQRYSYDDLDRLTGYDAATGNQGYDYDLNGNRTALRIGTVTYPYTNSPSSNRLDQTTGPVPAKRNTYDAAGNLTGDGTNKFGYGTNGRLSSVTSSSASVVYRYNGFGQRVVKTGTGAKSTYYVYDQEGRLLGEYDSAGAVIQETVYLGDMPVAVLKPKPGSAAAPGSPLNVYNVYADHLNTPRVLAQKSDNRIVWRWDNADPFGAYLPDGVAGTSSGVEYNPRFPGQVFDKETNLHYNYYRDYDPQAGKYVQSDPIGLEGGINTYGYVGGNPLSRIDPYGLQVPTPIGPLPLPPLLPPRPRPPMDPWNDTHTETRVPGLDPKVPKGPGLPKDPDGGGACRKVLAACMQAANSNACPGLFKGPVRGMCFAAYLGCMAAVGDD